MASNLSSIRQSLSNFSDKFTYCIDEQSSTENSVVIRTTGQNRDEVRLWLSEFACVAGVSYAVNKVFKEGEGKKKAFREEYVCHHSNRNKLIKSDSKRLVGHKHKATDCKHRANVQCSTVNVMHYEEKLCRQWPYRKLSLSRVLKPLRADGRLWQISPNFSVSETRYSIYGVNPPHPSQWKWVTK